MSVAFVLSVAFAVTNVFGCARVPADSPVRSPRPVLTLGIMTDTHIGGGRLAGTELLRLAAETFRRASVDAIVNVGDICDWHNPEFYAAYRRTVDEVFASAACQPPEYFVYAWHDANRYAGHPYGRSVRDDQDAAFADVERLLRAANKPDAMVELKGIPVLFFRQFHRLDLMEEMVSKAERDYPDKPILVFDHVAPACTSVGSDTWGSPDTRRLFDRHPRVIHVSGHTHGTLLDERNIWQGAFTAVNAGCLYAWGPDRQLSFGVLVADVFPDRIRFRRVDVRDGRDLAPAWTVPLPFDPATAPYATDRRRVASTPPRFAPGAALKSEVGTNGARRVSVSFPRAATGGCACRYDLRLERRMDDGRWEHVLDRTVRGDVDLPPGERTKDAHLALHAAYFEPGLPHRLTVVPVGFFGLEGEPLVLDLTGPAGDPAERCVFDCRNPGEEMAFEPGTGCGTLVPSNGYWTCSGRIVGKLVLPPEAMAADDGSVLCVVADFDTVCTGREWFQACIAGVPDPDRTVLKPVLRFRRSGVPCRAVWELPAAAKTPGRCIYAYVNDDGGVGGKGPSAIRFARVRVFRRPRHADTGVAAAPVRTAVFAGNGPRGRGCVEWFRLISASPELELKLVDADMIRHGALDDVEALVMPGGSATAEKVDLGPEGVARVREFIRNGGGYVGTCAGCFLLLDERIHAGCGINVIPYRSIGSKGGFTMPISVNAAGARAMGIPEGVYPVRYHGGPILVPSTNVIEGAHFETWATYDSDFDCPKSDRRMFGHVALVGGTYGKGRVCALACHPEANVLTLDLVKGAFRHVLGREVTFPVRIRRPRALTVGMFASVIGGLETARTIVTLDGLDGVDFFPLADDEVSGNWLDRVDCLVLPNGYRKFYEKKLKGRAKELIESFAAAGGKVLTWGCGVDYAPKGSVILPSGEALVEFVRRESSARNAARAPIGVFDSGVGGLTVLEQLLTLDRVNNGTGEAGPDGVPDLRGESFVQLADMANLHYGSYAAAGPDGCAFLRELAIRDAFFLLSGGYFRNAAERVPGGRKAPAKIIVVACNTATAYGLPGIETSLAAVGSPAKVIGVVNAGARSALERCGAGPDAKPFAIGVLSTPGTDASGIYPKTIAAEAAKCGMRHPPRVVTRGCANLADAIQFGRPEAAGIARRYFRELVEDLRRSGSSVRLKALVFGCTHYPFMRAAFEAALREMRDDPKLSPFVDDAFAFVDPGVETAAECRAVLAADGLLANRNGDSEVSAYVSVPCTDLPSGRVGEDGTLEDGYKYSRKPGQDVVDTKFVPLDAGIADRAKFENVIRVLPAVRRHLSGRRESVADPAAR